MPSPRRRAALVLLAITVPALLLWIRPPGRAGWYPPCPTHAWFGVQCPGCGSTRACGALVRGDVAGAWRFNPALVLVGVPILGWLAASSVTALIAGRPLRPPVTLPPRAGWWIAAALLAYMALRNIPGASFDWLRPPESR